MFNKLATPEMNWATTAVSEAWNTKFFFAEPADCGLFFFKMNETKRGIA
jgi:hypothetical protein